MSPLPSETMVDIERLQIIKLGGSLITNKQRVTTFRAHRMRRLARELTACKDPIVLLHGTGSFGKPQARKYHYEDNGYVSRSQVKVVVEVSDLLNKLRALVVRILLEAGVEAMSITPAALFRTCSGRIVKCELELIRELVNRNIAPVISGDLVTDEVCDFSACSSDMMGARLAVGLSARRLIFATDVPGVMSYNGGRPSRLPELSATDPKLQSLLADDAGDVSRGMQGKLEAGFEAARAGVETWVIDGRKPGRLAAALGGDSARATKLLSG